MKDKIKNSKENLNTEKVLQKLNENKEKIIRTVAILSIIGALGIGATGIAVFAYAKSNINYTEKQMKEIALKKVPGEVIKVKKEFNEEDFSFEYEFKIKDKENILREITVNTSSGAIVDLDNHKDMHED